MTTQEKFHLFDAIDDIPQFRGAGVAYVGDGQCEILRQTMHVSGFDTWIVLEPYETSDTGKLELPQQILQHKPSLWKELVGLGINCASAALTGTASGLETAAAPLTAGASLVLVTITGAGAVATSMQCGLSIGRVIDYCMNPNNITLLDSEAWVNSANDMLDYIALAGDIVSAGQAVQGLLRLQKASGKPFKLILDEMDRPARKRLARELAEYAGTKSGKQFKALVRAGELTSIYTQKSVDLALKKMLLESISTALSIAGSATSGVLHKAYLVYVVQETN